MKIGKKNYPQVYLAECKYRVTKIQMYRFISTELDSDSESENYKMVMQRFILYKFYIYIYI